MVGYEFIITRLRSCSVIEAISNTLCTRSRRGRGGGVSSLLYIYIAYYMQKGGEGVQIACKTAYVLNGRPLIQNHSPP